MAVQMTYASLFHDVQTYLERGGSGVTDRTVYQQIPSLINGAERKLAQLLKLQGYIEVLADPTGLQIGLPVIPKPDRWRQTVSLNFGTGTNKNSRTPLYPRSYEFCRAYWPDDSQTDVPKFYADYNYSNWLIVPTPDQDYPLEVNAYMMPPLLDNENQQNWSTEYIPNALLYGTLLEATPFLKNDERIPTWQGYYNLELSSLTGQDMQKILDRSADRMRP